MEVVLAAMLGLSLIVGAWERRQLVQAIKDQDKGFLEHIEKLEGKHQSERRELANRIQHPNHMPVPVRPRQREKREEEAPTQRIGTVLAPRDE